MASDTARALVIKLLEEAGEDGLSKSRLRNSVGGNPGAFRRLIQSMIDKDEIVVENVDNPNWGPTKIHRLGPAAELVDA